MTSQQKELMVVSGQLISMSQAAKMTPYSAEYLSLLARKGRLTAVKINRDWLTTPRVVLEYVKKQKIKHEKLVISFAMSERRLS